MKFSIKFLKRMISVILATVIATSCVVGSVGAIKAPTGSSQTTVKKMIALNGKIENYRAQLLEAASRLKNFHGEIDNNVFSHKKNQMHEVINYMTNHVDNILGKVKQHGLNYLVDVDNVCYEEVFDEFEKVISLCQKDVNILVEKMNGTSLDLKEGKVFYTKKVSGINLDEDKDENGNIKEEITYDKGKSYLKNFFGNDADILHKKLKKAGNILEHAQLKMSSMEMSPALENYLIAKDLGKKMNQYKTACSDFSKMKQILKFEGPYTKELENAIANVTGSSNLMEISAERYKQFINNKESMLAATGLIDTAITNIKGFINDTLIEKKATEETSYAVKEASIANDFDEKVNQYKIACSDFSEAKQILKFEKPYTEELENAIANVTGSSNLMEISAEKYKQFINNKKSMLEATGLIDTAISNIKGFIGNKLIERKKIAINTIATTFERCVNELAKEENVKQAKKLIDDPNIQEVKKDLIKTLSDLTKFVGSLDYKDKPLIYDLIKAFSEFVKPYYYDEDGQTSEDDQTSDSFVKKTQDDAKKFKDKFSMLLNKINQLNANQLRVSAFEKTYN